MTDAQQRKEDVQQYYGQTLQHSDDLKTDACCSAEALPLYARPLLEKIHPEVKDRFYGCGSPIPPLLEGKTVLDLGCGTGRDSYIIAQLVGEKGKVIGVDMTDEQIAVARRYEDHQRETFGYTKKNTTFKQGYIENLAPLGIEDNSVDVVISNCVINLSSNKEAVFAEIKRILKPGGELYFSDIFADRRVPQSLQDDAVIVGECLGGALYEQDFRRLLAKVGFSDYRVMSNAVLALNDPEIIEAVGDITFFSTTIRSFNCEFEDKCEDFGQTATYKGTIPHHEDAFMLDDHHLFETGKDVAICGNSYLMLSETRFAPHFELGGDFSTHKGLFGCESPGESSGSSHKISGGCC